MPSSKAPTKQRKRTAVVERVYIEEFDGHAVRKDDSGVATERHSLLVQLRGNAPTFVGRVIA